MKKKSWHINRRTMLKGTGVCIALPFLESMVYGDEKSGTNVTAAKKRFCTIYFPFGATGVPQGQKGEEWNWLPEEKSDGSYQFREVMKPLNPLKDRISIIQGLHHPRSGVSHSTADTFLTGSGSQNNSISVDQAFAAKVGNETRFSSLVLSFDGGIGKKGATYTLSYGPDGLPIPAQSNVRRLFDTMFSKKSRDKIASELRRNGSILDRVLQNSKNLNGKLGKRDQEKLDQYLSSIRQLEKRIQKQEAWLQTELPDVDPSKLALDASIMQSPEEYIQCMFDIIYLSLQTDMTRAVTFQMGSQDQKSTKAGFAKALGMKGDHHRLAHQMYKDNGAADYGKYLQYLSGHYGKLMQRLKDTKDANGTMLDNTLLLFGSSNSIGSTHGKTNLPISIAGGEAMGFKHGQYLKYNSNVPMSNLHATILDQLGAPVPRFADCTSKRLSELLKA